MSRLAPAKILVLRPGLLTTIQDLGRPGLQRFGVSVSGAMDPIALRCANRLVGNPDSAAALEITLRGPALRFERAAVVALAGGVFDATLDGHAVPGWTAFEAGPGSTLVIGERRTGARGYLALSGGFDVPVILGSRSTHLRSGMGGLAGRAIRQGDELVGGRPAPDARRRVGQSAPAAARPTYGSSPTLRVILGPQVSAFEPGAVEALTQGRYTVSPQSDRMGYRLTGPPLIYLTAATAAAADMISDATPLGALQVPATRQPILLMADRQTTGGYPKIAVVISADLPLAGQLVPGDTLAFAVVEVAAAQRLLREQHRLLAQALPPHGS